MRNRNALLAVFTLCVGLILVVAFRMQQSSASTTSTTASNTPLWVYRAQCDLGVGEELTEDSVKLERWPGDSLPANALNKAEQLVDMVPHQRLCAGEPLVSDKLSNRVAFVQSTANLARISRLIRDGHCVRSIKVFIDTEFASISAGDHVDIMSVDVRDGTTKLVLENVELFSKRSGHSRSDTVSVLINSEQVAVLREYALVKDRFLRVALSPRRKKMRPL